MQSGYELFDHTADMGVRVHAPSLPELVCEAGRGFYDIIGELEPEGPARPERFDLSGPDLATLLRDYLAQLLLIFERDGRMITEVTVEIFEPGLLKASGQSRSINRARSLLDREVKAVTYHGLQVRKTDGGYEAEYIVDV